MKQKELEGLSDEQLLKEKKKIQSNNIVNASLIGLCIGVMVYGAVKNGFGFFTFLPLVFVYFLSKNGKNIKALDQELKSRNLL